MVLGSRGDLGPLRLGRCLVVWGSGTAGLGCGARIVLPVVTRAWAARGSLAKVPVEQGLADVCALVLLGCLAWAWLALTATVAEAARSTRGRARPPRRVRPWRLPSGVRRVVLAACGVALVAGLSQAGPMPAGLASPGRARPAGGLAVLAGLPLPDRATAPPRRRARTVVVRPGDCLWSIAARELPPGAPPAAVAARWHNLYELNRAVIGPDPDVLVPHQRLILPPPPGKDPS